MLSPLKRDVENTVWIRCHKFFVQVSFTYAETNLVAQASFIYMLTNFLCAMVVAITSRISDTSLLIAGIRAVLRLNIA